MKSLFLLLLALAPPLAAAQPESRAMPQNTLPVAILLDESPIAADGGSYAAANPNCIGQKTQLSAPNAA